MHDQVPFALQRRAITLLFGLLAVAAGFTAGAGAAEPVTAEEIHARRDVLFGDPSYQTRLPRLEDARVEAEGQGGRGSEVEEPNAGAGGWPVERRAAPRRGEPVPPRTRAPALGGAPAAWLRGLLWVVLGVAVVLLAAWLFREIAAARASQGRRHPGGEETAEDAEEAPAAPAREDAVSALARRGAWDEAVHLLLLAALEAVSRHCGAPLAPSRTSREILAECDLGETAGGALRELVAAVERSFFGGRALGRGDFERCRTAHGILVADLGGTS